VDRIHRVISPRPAADEKAIMMIVNLTVIGIIWANGSAYSASINRSPNRSPRPTNGTTRPAFRPVSLAPANAD
jgi:hypothetical protein